MVQHGLIIGKIILKGELKMKNESQDLVSQTSKTSLGALAEDQIQKVTIEVIKVSMLKGVTLTPDGVKAWIVAINYDIENKIFTLADFILACGRMVRRTIYNRLDYSDFYKEAVMISYRRINDMYFSGRCEESDYLRVKSEYIKLTE